MGGATLVLCAISSKNKLKATHNYDGTIATLKSIVRNIFKEQIESNSQPAGGLHATPINCAQYLQRTN